MTARASGVAFSADSTGHLRSLESGRRTVGRTGSRLIMLNCHPRPDVRGTVAKHNTPAGFVLSQDTDGVTICEHQIGQIQHKDTADRLCIDYLAELVYMVGVKSTADREHK